MVTTQRGITMFLNDWKDSKIEGIKADFGIDDADLEGVTVLLASYTYEDYSGDASAGRFDRLVRL